MAVAVTAVVLAVLVVAMTRAAARGRLPANGLLGIRTPATQRSDTAWRAGHRAAFPVVTWGGLVVLFGALAVLVGAVPSAFTPETAGLVLIALEGIVVVVGAVVADRAARRH
jgi:uncharacterized membrane protein